MRAVRDLSSSWTGPNPVTRTCTTAGETVAASPSKASFNCTRTPGASPTWDSWTVGVALCAELFTLDCAGFWLAACAETAGLAKNDTVRTAHQVGTLHGIPNERVIGGMPFFRTLHLLRHYHARSRLSGELAPWVSEGGRVQSRQGEPFLPLTNGLSGFYKGNF